MKLIIEEATLARNQITLENVRSYWFCDDFLNIEFNDGKKRIYTDKCFIRYIEQID